MKKDITRERIEEISKTLKPLVRKDGKLYSIEDVDPIGVAFTWDPKFKEEVSNLKGYERVKFFSYSYPLFWKPSIAEVFIEIQDNQELIEKCRWFEVVQQDMDTTEGKGNFGLAIFYTEDDKN